MKENKFRNTETATQISEIILSNTEFCKMYSISTANMNVHVDKKNDDLAKTNRVTEISEEFELSKQIINTLSLDSKHINAVKRIQVWLDSDVIVVFVGAVYAVHCKLATAEETDRQTFETLFTESFDTKYYEKSKLDISEKTESRHTFDSIDKFQSFFTLLAKFVVARKTALTAQQTDSTAQQTETAEEKKTAQQKSKQQKRQRQQKSKEKKADLSKVNAETLAELTKEIIESETKTS